jgi:hypothetical protein
MVLVDVVADVEISLVTRKVERETIPKMEQIDDQVKEVAEMKYVMIMVRGGCYCCCCCCWLKK